MAVSVPPENSLLEASRLAAADLDGARHILSALTQTDAHGGGEGGP